MKPCIHDILNEQKTRKCPNNCGFYGTTRCQIEYPEIDKGYHKQLTMYGKKKDEKNTLLRDVQQ